MGGKLFLGNQVVTPVIIHGEEKIYNVDGYDWLGEINAQGVLEPPTKDLNLIFNGVIEINNNVLQEKFKKDTRLKSVSFPDLERIIGDGSFVDTFYFSAIQSVSFPKLKQITLNDQTFNYCFSDTKIQELYLPELVTIGDNFSFAGSCSNCLKLKEVFLPKLRTVGEGGMYQSFFYSDLSETDNFNSLETIDRYGLYNTFGGTNIKSFSFNSLKKVKSDALNSCFSECIYLTDVYFNSLDSNSFGGDTNQFSDMLAWCDGVTVHFPVGLDVVIGDWTDVLAGFGGTNTTILYDL